MMDFNNNYRSDNLFKRYLFMWIVVLTIVSFCFSKLDSFLFINSHHHPIADIFFAIITFAGDGYCVIGFALVLYLWKHRKLAIAIVVTYVTSGLLCATLKRTFHAPRPAVFFAQDPEFNVLSWLPLAYQNSFPSGHTTSVFAMVMTIALFSSNCLMARVALLVGCLTAYSRVYLGQHFVEDLWFGTVLGCAMSLICYRVYMLWPQGAYNRGRLKIPSLNV